VRLRKAELRKRVNGSLELRFGCEGLTSYAGLELLRRFFQASGLVRKVRETVERSLPRSDYGASRLVMLLVTLLISGGRRVRHAASSK
jgi:hypothetical protein